VRTFSRTSQFKKDVKLAGKRGKDLNKLKVVPDRLIAGDELPAQYLDHPLRGNFAGSRD
jgi:mRNA interferase YafQ